MAWKAIIHPCSEAAFALTDQRIAGQCDYRPRPLRPGEPANRIVAETRPFSACACPSGQGRLASAARGNGLLAVGVATSPLPSDLQGPPFDGPITGKDHRFKIPNQQLEHSSRMTKNHWQTPHDDKLLMQNPKVENVSRIPTLSN